jgi:hypothetical protein
VQKNKSHINKIGALPDWDFKSSGNSSAAWKYIIDFKTITPPSCRGGRVAFNAGGVEQSALLTPCKYLIK